MPSPLYWPVWSMVLSVTSTLVCGWKFESAYSGALASREVCAHFLALPMPSHCLMVNAPKLTLVMVLLCTVTFAKVAGPVPPAVSAKMPPVRLDESQPPLPNAPGYLPLGLLSESVLFRLLIHRSRPDTSCTVLFCTVTSEDATASLVEDWLSPVMWMARKSPTFCAFAAVMPSVLPVKPSVALDTSRLSMVTWLWLCR